MGATESTQTNFSRRGFLGWGATVLAAAAVPGATLLLTEQGASAAALPYAMTSWQGLLQQWVQVSAPGRTSVALQVVKVTNAAVATKTKMSGDSFTVNFKAPVAFAPTLYTVTAPGLGSLLLFIDGTGGTGGTARAVINRRLPG